MRIILKLALFLLFFNMSSALVIATGFFTTDVGLFSGTFSDLSQEQLTSTDVLFNLLFNGSIAFTIGTIASGAVLVGILTKNTAMAVGGGIVVLVVDLIWSMWKIFESIEGTLDPIIYYIGAMFLIGIGFLALITFADFSTGQRSEE